MATTTHSFLCTGCGRWVESIDTNSLCSACAHIHLTASRYAPPVPDPQFTRKGPERKHPTGLMPGDVDWLAKLLTDMEVKQGATDPRVDRLVNLLASHESDWRLNAEEREKKLNEQSQRFVKACERRVCVLCSALMWSTDLSGKSNVQCLECGRVLCMRHYLVHRKLSERQVLPVNPRDLSVTVKIVDNGRVSDDYLIMARDVEAHRQHICKSNWPPKTLPELRKEQEALQAALVQVDREMEGAPPELEKPPEPKLKPEEMICPKCDGSGSTYVRPDGHETPACSNCHGTGKVHTCESCAKFKYCGCGPCTGWKK